MIKNKTIIIPYLLPWDWSADYQRQTCLVLSKKNNLINLFEHKSSFFLFGKRKIKSHNSCNKKNIFFLKPQHFLPLGRFTFIKQINQLVFLSFLLIKLKRKQVIIWIFDPDFYFYLNLKKIFPKVVWIYDCVDFHSSIDKKIHKKIQYRQELLMKKSDLVFFNSKTLKKLFSKHNSKSYLVPQGFDVSKFSKSKIKNNKIPKNKPVIGFVGGINYRIDYELLEKIIRECPQYNFVFWGPKQKDSQDQFVKTKQKINSLQQYKNTIWGKSNNKSEIPKIIAQFDVCIIPYNSSIDFNLNCFPMKLFEYFYMGKPILSTPINELKHFPKFVEIGNSAQVWKKHITSLLAKPWPTSYKRQQRKLAIENSWENKIESISQIIENYEKKQ